MNKSIKVTIVVVSSIIILLGVMSFVSYNIKRQENNPIPIGIDKPEEDIERNEEIVQNKTKLEDLPEEYDMTNAILDKCVISIHGGKVYNKDELDRFIENVRQNNKDFVRCINYTIEGDMIIVDASFEGNDSFKVTVDATRDKWSNGADRRYFDYEFNSMDIEETEEDIAICLKNPDYEEMKEFDLTYYRKDAEIINNYIP